jgi:thiol-disulfide isomerase/thioredoxin
MLATMLLVAPAATGQEAKIDPKAQEVLNRFGKFYAGLEGFKVKVTISLTVEQKGQNQSQEFIQNFALQKPNKFSYALDSAQGKANIVSDGKEVSLFMSTHDKYAVEEAPQTFTELFQNPIILGSIGFGNAGGVMVALVSDDPTAVMLNGVEKAEYGGIVDLGDNKCHLIKATHEQFDWELWIDAGKQPLVRQFKPDLVKAFARLAKSQDQPSPFAEMKITNVVSYADWDTNPKFDAATFVFKAPADAERVDSMMELVTGRTQEEPAPSELLGKPAPALELELLAGGHLNLASLKGEKIVILDFWATWCGPCVRAMPIIEKVVSKYKDKGVELYAVNLQEGSDEIKTFLEDNKLPDVAVALDKDGKAARDYGANAIPQTVIIGKDGTVQVVKVGLLPNLEQALSKDLDALLEGKDLAAETLAEYKAKQQAKAEKKAAAKEAEEE